MQALLTVIVTWLSLGLGLPAVHEHPRVEIVSAAEMAQVRAARSPSGRPVPPGPGHGVHALYDDSARTIYLPENWSAASPAGMSLLVHEMVHHLQNAAGLKYACPAAREAPAYRAQARWLALFGRTLADEFGIAAMTLRLRTRCMF